MIWATARAMKLLDAWLSWACRCRISAFVELGLTIRKHRANIEAALVNNLSNALIESTNTKIRVLHRMAFGFKKPEHLIALALLDRGGAPRCRGARRPDRPTDQSGEPEKGSPSPRPSAPPSGARFSRHS